MRDTVGALVTGVQTCALPIWGTDRAGRGGIDRPYDGRDALRLDGREFPDEHHGKPGSRFRRLRAACLFWSDAIVLAACRHSAAHPVPRSEERRVGLDCVLTFRSRWSPFY